MNKKTILYGCIWGIGIILFLWVLFLGVPFLFDYADNEYGIVDYLGVSFAAATALFTGSAFTVAFVSIYQQNKGINRQIDLNVFSETIRLLMKSDRFLRSQTYIFSDEYKWDRNIIRKILGLQEDAQISLDDYKKVYKHKKTDDESLKKIKLRIRTAYEKIIYFCGRMEYLGFVCQKHAAQDYILEFYGLTITESYEVLKELIEKNKGTAYHHYTELYKQAKEKELQIKENNKMKTTKGVEPQNQTRKFILEIVGLAVSFGILVAAIVGFCVTKHATHLQTSMQFCSSIYPVLQSPEFVNREQYILRELNNRGDDICAIEDIKNDTLRNEIYAYCEYLNGIGIMIYEHMINSSVVIPYIGVNTIYIYRKLKPYLYITRLKRSCYSSQELSAEENKKIQKAASLYFVHYELLALEMDKRGEEWTEKLQSALDKQKRETNK